MNSAYVAGHLPIWEGKGKGTNSNNQHSTSHVHRRPGKYRNLGEPWKILESGGTRLARAKPGGTSGDPAGGERHSAAMPLIRSSVRTL